MEFAQRSDPGRIRENNEDYMGAFVPSSEGQVRSHGWVFALADGVGGQQRGEVASRVAVDSILAGFRAARAGELLPALLSRLVQNANARVVEAGMASAPGGVNIATTIVACALRYDRAVIAHAGDSRCYLVRKRDVTALTRDHTVANEQLRLGILSAREAAGSDAKRVLTRSLGTGLSVNVDVSEHQIFAGDVFLLCSDGLHGAVDEEDFARIVTPSRDLDLAVRDLVAMAYDNDGSDNISVLAARVSGVERVGMYRGRPYKLR